MYGGLKVKPASEGLQEGTGHFHIIIDDDTLLEEGTPIPFDDTHLHYGKGQTTAYVALPKVRAEQGVCLQPWAADAQWGGGTCGGGPWALLERRRPGTQASAGRGRGCRPATGLASSPQQTATCTKSALVMLVWGARDLGRGGGGPRTARSTVTIAVLWGPTQGVVGALPRTARSTMCSATRPALPLHAIPQPQRPQSKENERAK